MRRTLDIVVSVVGLVLLLPVLVVLGSWVLISSPGPALYRAKRIGQNGVPFDLYKFRTMVAGADQIGPGITSAQDNRVTTAGRFLRRTKLDELPQLWNVLRADMSLVGPRPEDARYVALYTPEQRRILYIRPGITSAASLAYRQEEQLLSGLDWEVRYRTDIMPAKIAVDLAYEAQRTVWSDIKLIARTVLAMFE